LSPANTPLPVCGPIPLVHEVVVITTTSPITTTVNNGRLIECLLCQTKERSPGALSMPRGCQFVCVSSADAAPIYKGQTAIDAYRIRNGHL